MVMDECGTTGGYQLHRSGLRCAVLLWRLRSNRQSRMELAWSVWKVPDPPCMLQNGSDIQS